MNNHRNLFSKATDRLPLTLTMSLTMSLALGLSGCTGYSQPRDDSESRWVRPQVEVYSTPTGNARLLNRPALESHREQLNTFLQQWDKARGDRLWLSYHPDARNAARDIAQWLADRGHAPMIKEDPLLPDSGLHLEVMHYQARLPECGHWKNAGDANFENRPWPGFACSNTRNLGLMVADPADLQAPAGTGYGSGLEAAMAVNRKRNAHDAPAASTAPVTIMTGGNE